MYQTKTNSLYKRKRERNKVREKGRASAVLAIQRALHSARKNIVRAGRGKRRWVFVHLRSASELILITRECTIFENTLYADSSLAGLPIVTRSIGDQAAALYFPLWQPFPYPPATWSPPLLIIYLSLSNALLFLILFLVLTEPPI